MGCLSAPIQKAGDRGSLARASGDYCIVVAHNPETGVTRIKLPSGSKKVCYFALYLHPCGMTSCRVLVNPSHLPLHRTLPLICCHSVSSATIKQLRKQLSRAGVQNVRCIVALNGRCSCLWTARRL